MPSPPKAILCLSALLLFLSWSAPSLSLTCSELAANLEQARFTTENETATVRLTNTNADQQTFERELFIKGQYGLGVRSENILVEVVKPAETQGVKLLIRTKAGQKKEQWLYLPDFKKTKRISDKQKSGNFLGSEFAFTDLAPFYLEDYECVEPIVSNGSLNQVRLIPRDKEAAAAYLEASYDSALRRVTQVDFFAQNGQVLKTARFLDYREIAPGKFRPFLVTMHNAQNQHESRLTLTALNVNAQLTEQDFSLQALSR